MRNVELIDIKGKRHSVHAFTVNEFIEGATPEWRGFFRRIANKGEFCTEFITFDIETAHDKRNEHSWMYHWQSYFFGVRLVFGRTWEEFNSYMKFISEYLGLGEHRKVACFIHNAGYEFAFLSMRYEWSKVFAKSEHEPLYFESDRSFPGIEFRDSFSLTGKSLASSMRDTPTCPWIKRKDLNYDWIYTPEDELLPKEYSYCAIDVMGLYDVVEYIAKRYQTPLQMPLTFTGMTRKEARDTYGQSKEWRKIVRNLTLDTACYKLYTDAARGGDAHASAWACSTEDNDEIWYDVRGKDICSSYPYIMACWDGFPLSPPHYVSNPTPDQLQWLIAKDYVWIAELTLHNVHVGNRWCDRTYIPLAKCIHYTKDVEVDNGRVVSASAITIAVTHLDYKLIAKYYNSDDHKLKLVSVNRLIYHTEKGLLPKGFRDFVINLYGQKTKLKGLKDDASVENYMLAKGRVNAMFGMCFTRILHPDIYITADGKWEQKPVINVDEKLLDAQGKRSFFTPYPIGVFVAAAARYRLHEGLQGVQRAIYWDTDSCKYFGDAEAHFDQINRRVEQSCIDAGYTLDEYAPMDVKGIRHPLGVWDTESEYAGHTAFKCFGAKKYILKEESGKEHITVAGLGRDVYKWVKKKKGSALNIHIGDTVDKKVAGRLSANYITEPYEMIVKGVTISEESYAILNPATYTFSDKPDHVAYILSEKERLLNGESEDEQWIIK